MVKKIGKLLILCCSLSLFGVAQDPTLTIRVTDIKNNALKHPAVGVPFCVVVTVKGAQSVASPKIHGLDQFASGSVRSSTSFQLINGVSQSEVTFFYTVRADKEGVFTLGPVTVSIKGKKIESKVIRVEVTNKAHYTHGSDKEIDHVPAQLELIPHTDQVYVGEPLHLTIRFSALDGVRTAQDLEVTFLQWTLGKKGAPRKSTIQKDGASYVVVEQDLELFSYQEGLRLIPALTAACYVPRKRKRSSLFNSWFSDDFFGNSYDQEVIQSNSCQINIRPLPAYENNVHGVGIFKNITASIDHDSAHAGEGIVLRLSLEGEGNMAGLEAPPLKLPPGFRSYDSKSELTEHGNGSRKDFEYIVQAYESGDHVIPEQTFTFFNYKKEQYESLKTQPLPITIAAAAPFSIVHIPSSGDLLHSTNQGAKEPIRPLSLEMRRRSFYIPWWVMIMLCLGLGISGLGYIVWRFVINYLLKKEDKIRFHRAFSVARKRLKKCKKDNNPKELYTIIVNLLSSRFRVPQSVVSGLFIENKLREAGIERSIIETWKKDFAQISACAFDSRACDATSSTEIISAVGEWLLVFEKVF